MKPLLATAILVEPETFPSSSMTETTKKTTEFCNVQMKSIYLLISSHFCTAQDDSQDPPSLIFFLVSTLGTSDSGAPATWENEKRWVAPNVVCLA